jgi:integrase
MASDRQNFTKAVIDGIPTPEAGKRSTTYDTKAPGLCVITTATGSKTFYVYRKVNGRPERIRIGPCSALSIEQARKKAAEIVGQIAMGEDPQAKRRQLHADPTFGELFAWYIEAHAKARKGTWKQDQGQFDRYLTQLAKVKASRVTKDDLRSLHNRLKEKGIYTANRALWLVRAVYNQAIRHDIVKAFNPAVGIQPFKEQSRDRRLTSSEVPAFFQAVADEPNAAIRDYVLLSLYTGARKANVLAMRWDQIDFDAAIWRIPETKNGTPQAVPIGDGEVAILKARQKAVKGPWVFPGEGDTGHMVEPKNGWARILKRAGITDLRLHDLRRTLGSWMVDTGASLAVIGKTLNHKSQAATAIYARLSLDPVREAKTRALDALMASRTGEAT